MSDQPSAMRERFEQWYLAKHPEYDVEDVERDQFGDYKFSDVRDAWVIWQAAQIPDEKIEEMARQMAQELRRRCNTKLSLLHQSAWYEAANELEKFSGEILREGLGGGK